MTEWMLFVFTSPAKGDDCMDPTIQTSGITVWFGNCSAADRKALQQVVKTAQRITGTPLPAIKDIQRKRCLCQARIVLQGSSQPVSLELYPNCTLYSHLYSMFIVLFKLIVHLSVYHVDRIYPLVNYVYSSAFTCT